MCDAIGKSRITNFLYFGLYTVGIDLHARAHGAGNDDFAQILAL
jgi:hypothetical protein